MIKRLIYNFKKWKLQARYCDLDMDMQCTNMTYKEYQEELRLLNLEMDKLNASVSKP